MKHILLTLVAAATAATASDTPAEAVQVRLQDAVITHYDSSSITSQGSTFSVAITLDVSGLRVLLEAGQQNTLWTDIKTQTGVATGGSPGANDTIDSSRLIGFLGDAYGTTNINYSENLADLNGDQEGTGWDNATYAGMVYTHDAKYGSSVYFTILDKDNKELTQSSYITNADLKSSATLDTITFHSSTTATFYYDMALNAHQAQALAIAAASVPEPATAMLSLLALAGVAARRRR